MLASLFNASLKVHISSARLAANLGMRRVFMSATIATPTYQHARAPRNLVLHLIRRSLMILATEEEARIAVV